MNPKNMRIGTQLKLGFAVLLLLVVVLGLVAYLQTAEISRQTETLYSHPLQVRRAIGVIRENIRVIQVSYRDVLLASSSEEIEAALQRSEVAEAEALRHFTVLRERYLGPRAEVETALNAFIRWNSLAKSSREASRTGNTKKSLTRVVESGDIGAARQEVFASIGTVDAFSLKKGDALFASSVALQDRLHRQLLLIIAAIIVLSLLISYFLAHNIRSPLAELGRATRQFHDGDTSARCSYHSTNEFGELAASFNGLAKSVELHLELNEKAASLAGLMLSEDDAKKFFATTLSSLAEHTGSHMAAVYLLSDDSRSYDHFVSLGLDDRAKQSFSATSPEGEFGAALAMGTVQHIKTPAGQGRFAFHTVAGTFIPSEIITIPIYANTRAIAMLSLATLESYGQPALQLIDTVLDTLNARIEGILAYKKVKEFTRQLEEQNSELQAQESEMAVQQAELIQQNSELEMQKRQLDEASRQKTVFLSNMSHELRTPLNSVIALSGVLNRSLVGQIPAEAYSYLEVIERNGKYLLTLINDILDISRIESGREDLELTQFTVDSLIAELVDLIQPQAIQKKIALRQIRSEPEILVVSDSNKYRHILQNVIGNAVKFTENGHVAVATQQQGEQLVITVTDTGIGIAADHLPHIFDEFRQADGSTSRRFGGTGLGLAIAKKNAQLLGGTLSVESTPGEGSQFTITLPLRHPAAHRLATEADEPVGGSLPAKQPADSQTLARAAATAADKTILLVDDSEPVIIQMKDILGAKGYQLEVARDGAEALALIDRAIPDAMILDLMMPGIDGFTVLETLREADRTAHIPILILTAKHITKDELSFLKRNNIHQLIQKGDVNRIELLSAVATMVFPQPLAPDFPPRPLQTLPDKPVVLVVEDNADNRLTVKALMADRYTVLEAVDGQQGVDLARAHQPHLIIMDIELPGMNGLAALKAIRQDPQLQQVPVIALTAGAMAPELEAISAHGFDGLLLKPIDDTLFFAMIDRVLYGR